jgi:hypothetical protein
MGNYTDATGTYSTAMGYNTVASGNSSTAMGRDTDASGDYSTAMGNGTNASGYASTAMGYYTDATGLISTAMGNATDASGNTSTAMGYNTEASGDYSTAMGNATDAGAYCGTSLGLYNYDYVYNSTSYHASNYALHVGNGTFSLASSALRLRFNGDLIISGSLSQSSDIRLKTNITPMGNVLSSLEFITPITYEFKDTDRHPEGLQIGFSAQEIQAQFPELVSADEEGTLGVKYGQMSAVLLQAVKEQQEMIKKLEERITQLENN